jgi:hypothetical protein
MPKGISLFAEKNFAPDTVRFREGNIEVVESKFVVAQDQNAKRAAFVALEWTVKLLDADMHPMKNEEGEEQKEVIRFGLGGQSLQQVHPGKADGPEDDQREDGGTELGVAGPTLFFINEEWQLNPKSAIAHLIKSLNKVGFKPNIIERLWAPDYVGLVAYLGSEIDPKNTMRNEKTGKDEPLAYKVITKLVKAPYDSKGTTAKARRRRRIPKSWTPSSTRLRVR